MSRRLAPTWSAVLPIYIEAIRHGDDEARAAAVEELRHMAAVADDFVRVSTPERGDLGELIGSHNVGGGPQREGGA